MTSRRGFLAALGLGAGASLLGLPASAQACGFRRRRRGNCAPIEISPKVEHLKVTVPYATCTCCCPHDLYQQVGLYYYYHSMCCLTGASVNAASLRFYTNLPLTCPNVDCIGSCAERFDPVARPHVHTPLASEPEFFLDPKAIWLDVDPKKPHIKIPRLHADAYINGIVPQTSDALVKGIKPNPDMKTTITGPLYVKYTIDKPHYVALFTATRPGACGLNFGHEVSDTPNAVEPDGGWLIPKPEFPHYHQVKHNKVLYHVASLQLD